MNPKRQKVILLSVASAFGMVILLFTLSLCLGNYSLYVGDPQMKTRRALEKTERLLMTYRTTHGVYPAQLDEATGAFWRDGWNRPLLYSLPDRIPLVESLGRDGVRGGEGLDADLSNRDLHPPQSRVPLSQKLSDPMMRPLELIALACGAMSGILIFVALKEQPFTLAALPSLLLQLGVAFVIAIFGATFIAFAHIPSGH